MTASQQEGASKLLKLHHGSEVLVLPNAWDVLSAVLFAEAGFPAIATTSASIAHVQGHADGESLAREEMLAVVARIAAAVPVPVTADLEAGYGQAPEIVGETVGLAIEAGAVGANIEDFTQDPDAPLFDLELAADRIRAARAAADAAGLDFVVNARTDSYLGAGGTLGDPFGETVRRLNAYWEAGARSLYVPALTDPEIIARLLKEIDGPLNILAGPKTPSVPDLKALGVRRLSVGSGLARGLYGKAKRWAEELRDAGTYGYAASMLGFEEIEGLL